MKTTLILDDVVVRRLKSYARRRGVSASRAAEELIRTGLAARQGEGGPLPPLPAYRVGAFLVGVDSRAALADVLRDPDVPR